MTEFHLKLREVVEMTAAAEEAVKRAVSDIITASADDLTAVMESAAVSLAAYVERGELDPYLAQHVIRESLVVERRKHPDARRATTGRRRRPQGGNDAPLEWMDEIQPQLEAPYLVKGLVDRGATSVVYGPSNCGKTFWVIDLAFHIAAGQSWMGRKVNQGGILYLAAEGGAGIANRIAALKIEYGCDDAPFALRRAGLDLLNADADTARVIGLAAEVEKRAPLAMIVVDTLSRVIAGGDENAGKDMTAFLKNIAAIGEATGAHILIVHHTGKDAARGARGWSGTRAAIDTEIEIAVDEMNNRSAKVTKQRDLAIIEEYNFVLRPIWLGQDQDGDDVTTCVVDVVEQASNLGVPLPPREKCQSILSEIAAAWEKRNPYSVTPQSRRTGRYAARALGQKFDVPLPAMEKLLRAWIDNEIVKMDVFEPRNNRSGLRVIGAI